MDLPGNQNVQLHTIAGSSGVQKTKGRQKDDRGNKFIGTQTRADLTVRLSAS